MRVQRLTRRADFERVRGEGQAHGTPWFVVVAARRDGGPPRVGVAAGRRVGSAVQRNRAKRLLREGIRPLVASIAPGWDILLMARDAVLEASLTQITATLDQVLRKLTVIAPQSHHRNRQSMKYWR
jgi:ribonuclease P protein component